MNNVNDILSKDEFSFEDLVKLLSSNSKRDHDLIIDKAAKVREEYVGNNVYLRGLIEYSNKCAKNCLYCGIRAGNTKVNRYELNLNNVIEAAALAYENQYGSVVIQTGERSDKEFIKSIDIALKVIQRLSKNELAITLSCGEQTEDTYRRWFESGASKYLLRIESSNPNLYYKLHTNDKLHNMNQRLKALNSLKEVGYHVGSGIMIGLPFQSYHDLAKDLLFLKELDVDMVGMGPYVEHADTPLYKYSKQLLSSKMRFELTIRMIALLRIIMKDINIASATALDTLNPKGRIFAIEAGANVLMPNLTPVDFREEYFLYNGKSVVLEADDLLRSISHELKQKGFEIGFGEQGNSFHFSNRIKS